MVTIFSAWPSVSVVSAKTAELLMKKSFHSAGALQPDIRRKHQSKTVLPQPHCLVANVNPALGQKALNISSAERSAVMQHHDQTDSLDR
ncbi:hypothetical protein GCM10023115_23910 [Pontixanthobacter gangjinensis]